MWGRAKNAVDIGWNNWLLEEHVTISSYIFYEYVNEGSESHISMYFSCPGNDENSKNSLNASANVEAQGLLRLESNFPNWFVDVTPSVAKIIFFGILNTVSIVEGEIPEARRNKR